MMEFELLKIFVLLFEIIRLVISHPIYQENSNLCETSECLKAATNILKVIDETVEPCEDFYQFACGNFLRETVIPEDETEVSQFLNLQNNIILQLKSLISEERPKNDFKHFLLPNTFYKACMNTALIEELGGKPIQEIVNSVGGWPVVTGKNWDINETWNWQKAVIKLNDLSISAETAIFKFFVSTDLKNSTKKMLAISESSLNFPREWLLKGFNDTKVKAYFDYMVAIAVEFGANREVAKNELKNCLQFEMDIANITTPKEEWRNRTKFYNPMTIEEIQKKYSYIDWLQLLNALMPNNMKIDEKEIVNVVVPNFHEKMEKLLQKTPKRTLANYIMWKVYYTAVSDLSENFRKHEFELNKNLTGLKKELPRWKKCLLRTSSFFSKSTGSLYIRKYFNFESKQFATELAKNIKVTFSKILSELDWIDNVTKKAATEKLNKMEFRIAFPNELLNDTLLEEYYNGIDIDENQYFNSVSKINIYFRNKKFSQLRLPIDPYHWTHFPDPSSVNAMYNPYQNEFMILAGILQEPFFNINWPISMNYGSIGSIIGHEITHGFDDEGKQHDANGKLTNWWLKDTEEKFNKKVECFIHQYGNYTDKVTGLKLNGVHTQGENIADNGGIKISYLAYKHWLQMNEPEPKLPGLNYTSEQLFWISAAQVDCAKLTKERRNIDITLNRHSIPDYRVLGVLKNMKGFAKDFKCPIGSPMNPVEKCEVW